MKQLSPCTRNTNFQPILKAELVGKSREHYAMQTENQPRALLKYYVKVTPIKLGKWLAEEYVSFECSIHTSHLQITIICTSKYRAP